MTRENIDDKKSLSGLKDRVLRDNGYGVFVTFRNWKSHVSFLKEKEHSQGKCHQKDAHVDNIDIPLGVGT